MFDDNYRRRQSRDESWYDTAQICVNGHVTTDMLKTAPAHAQKFCSECGAPTITACENCGESIRGEYFVPGAIALGSHYSPPKYCHACGAIFPWTAKTLEAARELADDLALSDDEKQIIKDKLPDIAQDTPTAEVSAIKVKRLLDKARPAGSVVVGVLYKLLIDYASETTKKILTGP
jgi:hypothetical protein